MKNPLILFSELLGATTDISFTETATLAFCYDHFKDDVSASQQNTPLLSQKGDVPLLGIQETE